MQYLRKAAAVSFVEHDRRTLLDKYHQERQRHRMDLGRVAHEFGPTVAARLFGTTPTVAAYWKKKLLNPELHPGTWGGFRFVFSSVALSPSLSHPLVGMRVFALEPSRMTLLLKPSYFWRFGRFLACLRENFSTSSAKSQACKT